jgi:hypothetical protein
MGASAAVRFWAALRIPSPWITPDEQTYALIGRSLYESGRFEILGRDAGLLSFVYPALIGLPFRVLAPDAAYTTAKALQALVMSLTAVPVYLWGRALMSRPWALAAAALTLAVPGLAYSGFLMTETAFYPILCVSAWAMWRALVTPSLENQLVLLAAVALAVATRLQALVLVPILVLALLLKLAFGRAPLRSLRPFTPVFGGLAIGAGLWAGLVATGSGSGPRLLGSYQVVGTASYEPGAVFRFVVYHLADLLLLTAVLPVLALAVLTLRAAAGAERSEAARSFVAVVLAYVVGFVGEVGLFTSSLLGRLGERYLLALAPLLFLAFALWLDRGAPRPRIAVVGASFAALALLLVLPTRFISEAAAPDAFSTIPLFELRNHLSSTELRLAILGGAAALLVLGLAIPRRRPWLLPAALAAVLVAASVMATRFTAKQARGFRDLTVGAEPRWIDRVARGPVAFVYGGEYGFSAGGPVWANLFWNRKVERIYTLATAKVAGPIRARRLGVAPDGRLMIDTASAVAAAGITFVGAADNRSASYVLWRLDQPPRISSRVTGMRLLTGDIDVGARMRVYACHGGALALRLVAPEARTIELVRDGKLYRSLRLAPGRPWAGSVPAPAGRTACTFELATYGGGVHADRFEFVRR